MSRKDAGYAQLIAIFVRHRAEIEHLALAKLKREGHSDRGVVVTGWLFDALACAGDDVVTSCGDDVKTKNPYEQDADIDRRTEAKSLSGKIHTYPGCEDVSAVGIYPVTDEVSDAIWRRRR